MPFHFCSDELLMIMAMIPFVGVFFRRLHIWYRLKFGSKPKTVDDICRECHIDVRYSGYTTEEEMAAQREEIKDYKF